MTGSLNRIANLLLLAPAMLGLVTLVLACSEPAGEGATTSGEGDGGAAAQKEEPPSDGIGQADGTGGSALSMDDEPGGSGGNGGVNATEECQEPPTRSLSTWFRADDGVGLEGGKVASWQDRVGGEGEAAVQDNAAERPVFVSDRIAGKPVIEFDGEDDELIFHHPVNGKRALTLVLVSRTSRYKAGYQNDCCQSWQIAELGVSGTSNNALHWRQTVEGGSVYLAPAQTEVSWRFGTGVEFTDTTRLVQATQETADKSVKMVYPYYKRKYPRQVDEMQFVDGKRVNVGDAFTWTVGWFDAPERRLFVEGAEVMRYTDPNDDAIGGTQDDAYMGRGRFSDYHFPGDIAEVLVYDAALSEDELTCLDHYIVGRYF